MATSRSNSESKTESQNSTSSTGESAVSAASVSDATPASVAETAPLSTAPVLKRPELIDTVVKRSNTRKKFAKPVVEAMLEVLGEALAEGREMTLPPLGRIKLKRIMDGAEARIIVTRIRQSKQGGNILQTDDGAEIEMDVKDQVAERAE